MKLKVLLVFLVVFNWLLSMILSFILGGVVVDSWRSIEQFNAQMKGLTSAMKAMKEATQAATGRTVK